MCICWGRLVPNGVSLRGGGEYRFDGDLMACESSGAVPVVELDKLFREAGQEFREDGVDGVGRSGLHRGLSQALSRSINHKLGVVRSATSRRT